MGTETMKSSSAKGHHHKALQKLIDKYFIPEDVVAEGHQRVMLYAMNALATKAMYGGLALCTAAFAVGNALMYRAEDYAQHYMQNGSLTKDELVWFKEIFEDWKQDYDAPLDDEIVAFDELIQEAVE